jgi:hypothetical protein
MAGNPYITSIVFGGFNPIVVDALAVKSMGISPHLIKCISKAHSINKWKISPNDNFAISLPGKNIPIFSFNLPKGWR